MHTGGMHKGVQQWKCAVKAKRYAQSEKGKARTRRYELSEKGKENKRRYFSFEENRIKANIRHRQYRQTPRGKEATRRSNERKMYAGGIYLGRFGFTDNEVKELIEHGKTD